MAYYVNISAPISLPYTRTSSCLRSRYFIIGWGGWISEGDVGREGSIDIFTDNCLGLSLDLFFGFYIINNLFEVIVLSSVLRGPNFFAYFYLVQYVFEHNYAIVCYSIFTG